MADPNRDPDDDPEWGTNGSDDGDWGSTDPDPADRRAPDGLEPTASTADRSAGGGGLELLDPSGRSPVEGTLVTTLVAIALVIVGFAVALGAAFAALVALMFAGVDVQESILLLPVSIVAQGIGFGVAALLYLRARGVGVEFLRVRVPSLRDVGWMIAGVVALLAALNVIGYLLQQAGQETAEHEIADMASEAPELLLVMIPLSFLVIGPGEELLFRGIIQSAFVEYLGKAGGVAAASVLFALAHLTSYGGAGLALTIALLFVLSLIMGGVYELTDNLVVPAMVHGAYNALLFLSLYVQLTGGAEEFAILLPA